MVMGKIPSREKECIWRINCINSVFATSERIHV